MSIDKLIERLRATYAAWNNPPSDGLPDGAGVVLEAASALASTQAEILRMKAALEQADALAELRLRMLDEAHFELQAYRATVTP